MSAQIVSGKPHTVEGIGVGCLLACPCVLTHDLGKRGTSGRGRGGPKPHGERGKILRDL